MPKSDCVSFMDVFLYRGTCSVRTCSVRGQGNAEKVPQLESIALKKYLVYIFLNRRTTYIIIMLRCFMLLWRSFFS